MKTLLAAAALTISGAVAVQAADIFTCSGLGYVMRDGQAERSCTSPVTIYWTKLGEHFVVYETNDRDGFHVLVTTQRRGERLINGVLAAGQSAAVSIPRAVGEAPVRIVLGNAGGHLQIAEPAAAGSSH